MGMIWTTTTKKRTWRMSFLSLIERHWVVELQGGILRDFKVLQRYMRGA
jgi:hypothetical protein